MNKNHSIELTSLKEKLGNQNSLILLKEESVKGYFIDYNKFLASRLSH